MSTGLSSPKTSEDALNQANLSTISTETSRTTGCPICSSLAGANTAANHSSNWKNSEKKCIVCGENCGKPALLDLFSGAGGAARGYQRAGFCVLGVDIKFQPHYAGCRFVQADAMTYPLEGFDVIHASPPCQRYSKSTAKKNRDNHPDYISAVRTKLSGNGKPYIIENVPGSPLSGDIVVVGAMVGLHMILRKRIFETNWESFRLIPSYEYHNHVISVVGGGTPTGSLKVWGRQITKQECADAMGIQWMTRKELTQAIPPAYTEWIGNQLMVYLRQP